LLTKSELLKTTEFDEILYFYNMSPINILKAHIP
jgi:hypothetical protein